MAQTIGIAGELESKTTEGKLADASQIKDISRGNISQKEINDGLQDEIGELTHYADTIWEDVEKIKNSKQNLTEDEYEELKKNNLIRDDVEYNILEDE